MRLLRLVALSCLLTAMPASLVADAISDLQPEFQDFLEDTRYLMLKRERKAFLALDKDHQREAFIEDFWAARDPYPHTERNEFRVQWEGRLELVLERYGDLDDDRSPILLLNGEPTALVSTDCHGRMHPVEIWYYDRSDRTSASFFLVFYRPGMMGRYRIWRPTDGFAEFFPDPPESLRTQQGERAEVQLWPALEEIKTRCGDLDPDGTYVRRALSVILQQQGSLGYQAQIASLLAPPPAREGHWLQEFRTTTTDLSAGAEPLEAELSWHEAGPDGDWTLMDGLITLIGEELVSSPDRPLQVELFGEIFREGRLFESFRYRFELEPSELTAERVPLVIQRRLRPGEYEAVIRVALAGSGREARLIGPVIVESAPEASPADESFESEAARRPSIRLVPPEGETVTGSVRIDAELALDDVARVRFLLDGRPILTKTRPPFSVSIDLGSLPIPHRVEAQALDREGEILAADLLELNPEPHRLSVQLEGRILPGEGERRLEVVASVSVPSDERLDRLELYREERRIATLFQPPWTASVPLTGGEHPSWVRAAAYLEGGRWVERISFLDGTTLRDHVDVQFVELFATVVDRTRRPVQGLEERRFEVLESDVPQTLVRFEQVEDLPIHVALVLDDSASMKERLSTARQAAVGFLDRVLQPGDRAAVVSFSHRPQLLCDFTDDQAQLHGALAELRAHGETALHDAVVFSLRTFGGLQGQRALLLLSDGGDRVSQYDFDEALEFARRSGVAIYTVGLAVAVTDQLARSRLKRLSAETGGIHFLVDEASELAAIYSQIEEDLRSRYLLAYQSSATSGPAVFRPIEVRVEGDGLSVRTSSGYYP